MTPAMLTYLALAGHPKLHPRDERERRLFARNVKRQAQRDYGWAWAAALRTFVDRLKDPKLVYTFITM